MPEEQNMFSSPKQKPGLLKYRGLRSICKLVCLGQLILNLAAAAKPVGLQVNHISWKLRCMLKVSFEIIYLNVKGYMTPARDLQ